MKTGLETENGTKWQRGWYYGGQWDIQDLSQALVSTLFLRRRGRRVRWCTVEPRYWASKVNEHVTILIVPVRPPNLRGFRESSCAAPLDMQGKGGSQPRAQRCSECDNLRYLKKDSVNQNVFQHWKEHSTYLAARPRQGMSNPSPTIESGLFGNRRRTSWSEDGVWEAGGEETWAFGRASCVKRRGASGLLGQFG